MVMNMAETGEALLTDNDKKLIYKVAFDSIPSTRRRVINIVAKYSHGATDVGIAEVMGMQYEAVKVWIEELQAIGVFTRTLDMVSKKYKYKLNDEYLETVKRFENIQQVEEELVGSSDIEEDAFAGL